MQEGQKIYQPILDELIDEKFEINFNYGSESLNN
jgi:hypothetical protein